MQQPEQPEKKFGEQPDQQQPFKIPYRDRKFYLSLAVTTAVSYILFYILALVTWGVGLEILGIFAFPFLYFLVAYITWDVLEEKDYSIAVGSVFGYSVAFLLLTIIAGPCGALLD